MTNKPIAFTFHHTSIAVANIERSRTFYANLGFTDRKVYEHPDGTFKICHMEAPGCILEIFEFADVVAMPESRRDRRAEFSIPGNKHFALMVPSLEGACDYLVAVGLATNPRPATGKTGLKYIFIEDPDGIEIEIVETGAY